MPDDERIDGSSETEVNSSEGSAAPAAEDPAAPSSPDGHAPEPEVTSATDAPDPAVTGPGSADAPDGAAPGSSQPAPADVPQTRAPKKRTFLAKMAELPLLLLLAFVIAVLIKTFLVQAFFIPSGSMLPTLQVGDRVLVEKLSYRWGSPSRGDIVVFAKDVFSGEEAPDYAWHDRARIFFRELIGLPVGDQEDYIKRIVAVGGDSVRYAGSPRALTVNGNEVDQPYIQNGRDEGSPSFTGSDCERLDMEKAGRACRVPAGHVFVMGDNRGNSEDSRILGPVDEEKIVGRAFLILWPIGDFGTL